MRFNIALLMVLSVVGVWAQQGTSAKPAPRVTIDSGVLQGTHFGTDAAEVAFLGIPYAAPPVGELRWRPPQRPASWKGVRKAEAYGPACPQLPSPWLPEMLGRKQMITDEACLYLNVWTTNLAGSSKQPVMVWIHGGGNVEGSQEWPPLGPVLTRHGVVVVTINYRLGVFGYFSHPALTAESPHHSSGNYGLLDQIEALDWVRRNIAQFGGDPRQVTVFGASSGSLDVCDLMASPLAAGLFRGAILQSGVCVDGLAPTLDHQESDGKRIAKDLSVADDPQALSRLRALPAEQLLHVASQEHDVDFNPTLDGWVFHEQPAIAFEQGRQIKVPVVVGSNADEVSIFASPIVGGKSNRPKTIHEYEDWLKRAFGSHAQAAFAAYPASSDSEVPAAFQSMDTDLEFGFGSRLLAREVAASGQKAYLYNFTYVGSGRFETLGAFHSEESILLSKRYWTNWVASPEDEKLSNVLIRYWVQFAKAGEPGILGLPPWPSYDPRTDLSQELGREVGQMPALRSTRFKVFDEMLREQLRP
jgi:para-nitrobenzyl esterase